MYFILIGSLILILIIKFFQSSSLVKYLKEIYLNEKRAKNAIDLSKIQYDPITFADCAIHCERIKSKLLEENYGDSVLYENIHNLRIHLLNLFEIAEKRCCGQIRANGYFSVCKIIFKYLKCIDQDLNSGMSGKKLEQEMDYFNKMSVFIMSAIEFCLLLANDTNLEDEATKKRLDDELLKNLPEFYNLQIFRQTMVKKRIINSIDSVADLNNSIYNQSCDTDLINNNSIYKSIYNSFSDTPVDQEFNSLPLFTPHLSTNFECINEAINNIKSPNKYLAFRRYFMFWLDNDLRYIYRPFNLVPFLRMPFYRYFQLIFSPEYRAKSLHQILSRPTLNFPFEIVNLLDLKPVLLIIDFLTRYTNTKSKELFIPSQNSILINRSSQERLTINHKDAIRFKKDKKIRCKLIRPKNVEIENCSKLMLHFHSGAFFCLSCDSHEIFLKGWVNSNRIPILSVDYKVKECFPISHKDCFDVYLWLRMAPEEEIRTLLGFYPKQIVIMGDSAGSNMALGTVLALNDLRIDYADKFDLNIQMPDGLFCIYSTFLINFYMCPSRIISNFDPALTSGFILTVLEGVLGLIPGLKPNTRLQTLKSYLFPSTDPLPWFVCEQDEFKRKAKSISQTIVSPFLNGLLYEKYDSLTDVPLHLVSAEFCPFVDDSVAIAKIWKGRVKIDVIPEMSHGFLNLKFLNKNAANATMYCGQKITEMFK